VSAEFDYDGDGKRVKSTFNGTISTYFVGVHYEVTNPGANQTITKYYYAGSQRIAMRSNGTLSYLLGDHLGSTSMVTDASGNNPIETRYKAWGEVRYASGNTPTKYTFTGQYSDSYINLLWYGSRHYDPALGRFISPDTIIPNPSDSQGWDRYAYTFNNPLRYVDPDGHFPILPLVLIAMAVLLTADIPLPEPTNFPINAHGGTECSLSLSGCFGDEVVLKDFSEHGEDNPIPIEEFEEFADEVAEDLYTHDLGWPGLEAGRGAYDTPFYNGGESERRGGNPEGDYPADQQVCIETIGCSGRSEINYIAQGMWGAAVNETKPVSIAITWTWKLEEYFDRPSEGTIFWLKYGYDYYKQWLKEHDKK
jgi:RHS repeat-associated protein